MGVDISLYRCRIGAFVFKLLLCRPLHKGKGKMKKYNRFTKSSDMHYRVFASCVYMLFLFNSFFWTMYAMNSIENDFLAKSSCCLFHLNDDFVGTPARSSRLNCNAEFEKFKLLLSNDIEMNPGPTDMDTILAAIKESESKLMSQMTFLQNDVAGIKQDLLSIKAEQDCFRSQLNQIKQKHETLCSDIQNTDRLVEKCQQVTENVQLDVEWVSNCLDQQSDTVSFLQKEVERLNQKNISNNMRIFGLRFDSNLDRGGLVRLVIDKVLKVACPSFSWSSDDIKSVRVVRQGNQAQPPIVIVSFRHDDDKLNVYRGRADLRKVSIRVGDDLTYSQRQELRQLKLSEGKTGYFYKGQLQVRAVSNDEPSQREFRRAVRKVPDPSHQPQLNTDQVLVVDDLEVQ